MKKVLIYLIILILTFSCGTKRVIYNNKTEEPKKEVKAKKKKPKKKKTKQILIAARILGYGKDYEFKYNEKEITVFNTLGKGFNECIYHKAILVDLYKTQYQIETKKIIPIEYNGVNVGYVESDIIVYDSENDIMIIIELKAQTNDLSYKEKFQVQKYMNHINYNIDKKNIIGLVVNFSQKNNTCLEVQNVAVYSVEN